MSFAGQAFDANYARAYGQHDFTMADGQVVSVLSEPTWEDFYGRLDSSSRLGKFVLSPELITSPFELEDIPGRQADIEERVAAVRELSSQHLDTTIVLGTATFNNPGGQPANSLVFINSGDIVAQTNKGFSFYPAEKQIFTLRAAPDSRTIDPKIAGMVCSDILGEGPKKTKYGMALLLEGSDEPNPVSKVTADTETVLLSTCWAIPLVEDIRPKVSPSINHEDRFRRQLESRIASLFRFNAGLREVIVADRLAAGSEVEAPYNGHFTRRES